MEKRVFLIVLDSFGIGEAPDAAAFGDVGSNTLGSIAKSPKFNVPNLKKMGLFNIEGVTLTPKEEQPTAAFARLEEVSKGKDTTIGHWEISGVESATALPVFPNGFPAEMLAEFEKRTGRKSICNKPYSGTDVIRDYGEEHMKTGALIVYTSADSVFQIAANEAIVPLDDLYNYCAIARELLVGDLAVGRVIARPFIGTDATNFKRTPNRHDYSLLPPGKTILDAVSQSCRDVISVGKISDIFAGKGVTRKVISRNNTEGMEEAISLAQSNFEGLCFINLVDFDMVYGHRNDVDGYANAMSEFDKALGDLLPNLNTNDLLILTADHGCDPGTPSTDHSREYVPLIIYGKHVRPGVDLKTRKSFATIATTIAQFLDLDDEFAAPGVWDEIAVN